jgi:hypothetical protein
VNEQVSKRANERTSKRAYQDGSLHFRMAHGG